MAMVMLNIGILAIVASFNSGAVALKRASHVSTASALADQQMELTGRSTYSEIALDSSADRERHLPTRPRRTSAPAGLCGRLVRISTKRSCDHPPREGSRPDGR